MTTIAQTMGPEAIVNYINPEEVVKRLAAIKVLMFSTVKTAQQLQQEQQASAEQQQQMTMMQQAGKFAEVGQKREQLQNERNTQAQAGSPPQA